jgi:hypothetical protein
LQKADARTVRVPRQLSAPSTYPYRSIEESMMHFSSQATLLMSAAADSLRKTAASRIILSTQISNNSAQTLYESLGYTKNEDFYQYQLKL